MQRLSIPVQLRWSDLDAFNHINNVQVARIMEEARVRALWASDTPDRLPTAIIDAGAEASTWTLIAKQEIEYHAPMPYFLEPIVVETWFSDLGGASLEICYEIFSPDRGTKYCSGKTVLVLVDRLSQKPRRISAEERAVWQPYLGETVDFRRK